MLRGDRRRLDRRPLRRDPGAPAPRPAARPSSRPIALGGRAAATTSTDLLDRNVSTQDRLSFLGGGCWPHYVPAVVDEIVGRGEFLTAYYGETYTDHGKLQAFFEYASLVGELVELRRGLASRRTTGARRRPARSRWPGGSPAARERSCPATLSPERRSVIDGLLRRADDHRGGAVRRGDRRARPGGARRGCSATTSPASTSRTPASSARSSPTPRPSASARTRPARSPSSASTRSRSACWRRRRGTARTSSAASCRASASTCTTAAASPGSSPRRTTSGWSPSTRPSSSARPAPSTASGASARCAGTA